MGAQSSRTYRGRGGSEAFVPLVLGEIVDGDPRQALRGSEDDVCAVCIGQLACAPTHSLRQCNHRFHALCLACALQAQQLCPMCRTEVPTEECNKLAAELLADASSAHLAYELLMEKKVEDDSIAAEERIIEKIRRDAKAGDDTRIPIFAALLGQGDNHTPQKASRSAAVRVAAVEGLRKLVPAFPREWIGYPHIVVLLQRVSLEEKDSEVRSAALFALREIAPKGDQETMSCLRVVLEGSKADSDVRLAAANAIQGLAERGNLSAARAAIVALTDRDPAVRSVGLTALQACCARGVGLELIGDIVDLATNFPETDVRTMALGVLGQVENEGGALGIAAATQCLEDKDEQVQSAALVSLRQMWKRGDAEAVSTLASLAMGAMGPPGGSHRLQMEALDALPRVAIRPNAPAAGAAATMLGCEDSTLRRTAATVLPQLCNKGDATVLMQLLGYVENHPNAEARRDAIEVLGNIATRDSTAVKAVLKRLSEASTDDELQLVAESALRRIG